MSSIALTLLGRCATPADVGVATAAAEAAQITADAALARSLSTWTSDPITLDTLAEVPGQVQMATIVSIHNEELFFTASGMDEYVAIVCAATTPLTVALLVAYLNGHSAFEPLYEASAGEGDDDDKIIIAKKGYGDFIITPTFDDPGTEVKDPVQVTPSGRIPLGDAPANIIPFAFYLDVTSALSGGWGTTGLTAEIGTIAADDDRMTAANILNATGARGGATDWTAKAPTPNATALFLKLAPTGDSPFIADISSLTLTAKVLYQQL